MVNFCAYLGESERIGDYVIMTDLGFTYQISKKGDVAIRHKGLVATTLRGKRALDFAEQAKSMSDSELQHLMARLTGNYKRGNERTAKNHPKNR